MKFFNITLKCPFCGKEFSYNILSMKAKHECPHCENELIVRSKTIVSIVTALPGFFVLLSLREILGISQMNRIIDLLYLVLGSILYIGVVYKLLCTIKSPSFIYQVDAQDPTMLERHKKNKK